MGFETLEERNLLAVNNPVSDGFLYENSSSASFDIRLETANDLPAILKFEFDALESVFNSIRIERISEGNVLPVSPNRIYDFSPNGNCITVDLQPGNYRISVGNRIFSHGPYTCRISLPGANPEDSPGRVSNLSSHIIDAAIIQNSGLWDAFNAQYFRSITGRNIASELVFTDSYLDANENGVLDSYDQKIIASNAKAGEVKISSYTAPEPVPNPVNPGKETQNPEPGDEEPVENEPKNTIPNRPGEVFAVSESAQSIRVFWNWCKGDAPDIVEFEIRYVEKSREYAEKDWKSVRISKDSEIISYSHLIEGLRVDTEYVFHIHANSPYEDHGIPNFERTESKTRLEMPREFLNTNPVWNSEVEGFVYELNWSAVSGADYYEVRINSGFGKSESFQIPASQFFYPVIQRENEVIFYQITAHSMEGSHRSSEPEFLEIRTHQRPEAEIPKPLDSPERVRIQSDPTDPEKLEIFWAASENSKVFEYIIQYRIDENSDWIEYGVYSNEYEPGSECSLELVQNWDPLRSYAFRIGVRAEGYDEESFSATVEISSVPQEVPKNPQIAGIAKDRVQLDLSEFPENAEYHVYQCIDGSEIPESLKNERGEILIFRGGGEYTISLDPESSYCFALSQFNDRGEGPIGSFSLTIPAFPDFDVESWNVSADPSNGDRRMVLQWTLQEKIEEGAVLLVQYRIKDDENRDWSQENTYEIDPDENRIELHDLSGGTEYEFRIVFRNERGEKFVPYFGEEMDSVLTLLSPPQMVHLRGDSLELEFPAVQGAGYYEIFDGEKSIPLSVIEKEPGFLSATVSGLVPGEPYTWILRAYENSESKNPFHHSVSWNFTKEFPLTVPDSIPGDSIRSGSGTDYNSIHLTWEIPDPNGPVVSGYQILIATQEECESEGFDWANIRPIDQNLIDIENCRAFVFGLESETFYVFRIAATNSLGIGEFTQSSTSSIRTYARSICTDPENLIIEKGDWNQQARGHQMRLRWIPYEVDAGENVVYQIERIYENGEEGNEPFRNIVDRPEFTFVQSPESVSMFRITPILDGKELIHSELVFVETPPLEMLQSPEIKLEYTGDPEQVRISWNPVIHADEFRIFFRGSSDRELLKTEGFLEIPESYYSKESGAVSLRDLDPRQYYEFQITLSGEGFADSEKSNTVLATAVAAREIRFLDPQWTSIAIDLTGYEIGEELYWILRESEGENVGTHPLTPEDIQRGFFVIEELVPQSSYEVFVKTSNDRGEYWSEGMCTTKEIPLPVFLGNPIAVSQIDPDGSHSIALIWNMLEEVRSSGFIIWVSEKEGEFGDAHGRLDGDAETRFRIGNLDPNTKYYIKIEALSFPQGKSRWSEVVSLNTLLDCPELEPEISWVWNANTDRFETQLSWNGIPGATDYRLIFHDGNENEGSGAKIESLLPNPQVIGGKVFYTISQESYSIGKYSIQALVRFGEEIVNQSPVSDRVLAKTPLEAPKEISAEQEGPGEKVFLHVNPAKNENKSIHEYEIQYSFHSSNTEFPGWDSVEKADLYSTVFLNATEILSCAIEFPGEGALFYRIRSRNIDSGEVSEWIQWDKTQDQPLCCNIFDYPDPGIPEIDFVSQKWDGTLYSFLLEAGTTGPFNTATLWFLNEPELYETHQHALDALREFLESGKSVSDFENDDAFGWVILTESDEQGKIRTSVEEIRGRNEERQLLYAVVEVNGHYNNRWNIVEKEMVVPAIPEHVRPPLAEETDWSAYTSEPVEIRWNCGFESENVLFLLEYRRDGDSEWIAEKTAESGKVFESEIPGEYHFRIRSISEIDGVEMISSPIFIRILVEEPVLQEDHTRILAGPVLSCESQSMSTETHSGFIFDFTLKAVPSEEHFSVSIWMYVGEEMEKTDAEKLSDLLSSNGLESEANQFGWYKVPRSGRVRISDAQTGDLFYFAALESDEYGNLASSGLLDGSLFTITAPENPGTKNPQIPEREK